MELWGKGYWIGLIAGISGMTISNLVLSRILGYKEMPSTSKVDAGYVVPSKLEIKVTDLKSNGGRDTLLQYEGKSYLFKVDDTGTPKVVPYEVKPTEIVPREK